MAASAKKGFVGIHVMVFVFFSNYYGNKSLVFKCHKDVNFSTTYGLYVW